MQVRGGCAARSAAAAGRAGCPRRLALPPRCRRSRLSRPGRAAQATSASSASPSSSGTGPPGADGAVTWSDAGIASTSPVSRETSRPSACGSVPDWTRSGGVSREHHSLSPLDRPPRSSQGWPTVAAQGLRVRASARMSCAPRVTTPRRGRNRNGGVTRTIKPQRQVPSGGRRRGMWTVGREAPPCGSPDRFAGEGLAGRQCHRTSIVAVTDERVIAKPGEDASVGVASTGRQRRRRSLGSMRPAPQVWIRTCSALSDRRTGWPRELLARGRPLHRQERAAGTQEGKHHRQRSQRATARAATMSKRSWTSSARARSTVAFSSARSAHTASSQRTRRSSGSMRVTWTSGRATASTNPADRHRCRHRPASPSAAAGRPERRS